MFYCNNNRLEKTSCGQGEGFSAFDIIIVHYRGVADAMQLFLTVLCLLFKCIYQ